MRFSAPCRGAEVAAVDAGADGGDHGLDFAVLQRFIQAGFFDVDDELTANREDRL